MAPHTYTVTITKDDGAIVITERSVSKLFKKLSEHIEFPDDLTPEAFGKKYISRKVKHENFTIIVSDRDKIPINESKKAYKKRRVQESKLERKEVIVLRKQVQELNELVATLQLQLAAATASQVSHSDDVEHQGCLSPMST